MNERIRELQSKSYLMCKQIVDDDGHVVVTPDQWFDKFAELIVRECAVPMITQARAMDADGGYQNNPVEVTAMNLHQGLLL